MPLRSWILIAVWGLSITSATGNTEEPLGVVPRGVTIDTGIDKNEVLQRWGPPRERIEQETKRQEIWLYADQKVLLRNGRVASVIQQPSIPAVVDPLEQPVPHAFIASSSSRTEEVTDATVDEILAELQTYGSDSPPSEAPPAPANLLRPTPVPTIARVEGVIQPVE